MDTELENHSSNEEFHVKRRKTWFHLLLRWIWKAITVLVFLAFRITIFLVSVTVVLVLAFIEGALSGASAEGDRQIRRARGEHRW